MKIQHPETLIGMLVLGCLIFVLNARGGEPNARKIVDKCIKTGKVQDSRGLAVMTLYNDKGKKRIRKTKSVSKLAANGVDQKRLIKFEEPADVKGTGLLTIEHSDGDDDIWIYLPALKKTRRIVAKEKANAFMGSEFSYADMLIEKIDDYKHKYLGKETLNGIECYKIQSTPASKKIKKEHKYSKKIVWIRTDNLVSVKVDFYDLKGKLLKTMTASKIKKLAKGKWLAMKREMVNHQNGRKTVLYIKKIEINVGIPDEYFTTSSLEK